MCHSCVSSSPDNMASYFLDSRLRGNDTPQPASFRSHPLPRRERRVTSFG